MSTRQRTIDDLDDVDDEDGILEEEVAQEYDLTLVVETAAAVIKGSDPRLEGPIDPDELDDEVTSRPDDEAEI
jgi:hypothetical protein